ncbi:MAG: hypothetical protein ACYC6Y_25420 [Thermoguttaceae bacterium]
MATVYSTLEFSCRNGGDCPCPVLELVNGKILFVGTPSLECPNSIPYGEGRVCTCATRNQHLKAPK